MTSTRHGWAVATSLFLCLTSPAAQSAGDLNSVLARVGERVEEYYRRARSVVCLETVRVQPLGLDLHPEGRSRLLEYELRVSWEPSPDDSAVPEARVLRHLLRVNGRPPRPGTEPECMDPRPVSPEPLAMLLAPRQDEYAFLWAGRGRVRDRQAMMLDYRSRTAGKPEVTWRGQCFSVDLPGRSRGRIWIDAATHDVLRVDEALVGTFDYRLPREHTPMSGAGYIEVQRADSSIRYRAVAFQDPEEIVLLPETIESLQVVRGAGVPRARITQTFSNYKRFVTEGRILQ
jgi:hypothetical protein